jgi:hypothetical protein
MSTRLPSGALSRFRSAIEAGHWHALLNIIKFEEQAIKRAKASGCSKLDLAGVIGFAYNEPNNHRQNPIAPQGRDTLG